MFECMRSRDVSEIKIAEVSVPTLGKDDNVPVAIIVGHNKKSQGAVNYLGETEYIFNSRIARKVKERLAELGVNSAVIFRPVGGYSFQCKEVAKSAKLLGSVYALELHFNGAANPSARGCEVLVRRTVNPIDNKFADYITDRLELYGVKQRNQDGVSEIGPDHNGFGMLDALGDVGILASIIEPCFAMNRDESKVIFENEDIYVEILTDACWRLATNKF